MLWTILVDNGYRFEYDCQIEARSAKAARKAFLDRERGSWKARPEGIKATRAQR